MSKFLEYRVTIAFVLLCVVWGTTYLGISVALQGHMMPFMLSGLRHVIAGMIFIVYCLARGERLPDWRSILKLGVIGLFSVVGGNALVCWAEQSIPSSLTAVICSLSPIFITLMSLFFFKGFRINWKIIAGLLLGLSGILTIFSKNLNFSLNDNVKMSVIFLVMANVAWALGSIFMKKNKVDSSVFLSIGIQMLLAGIVNCIISFTFEDVTKLQEVNAQGWWALAYLIVAGSLLGFGSYAYVLSHYPPARVSIHNYINTIIAVFSGWLIGNEHIDRFVLLGTFLVLSGVILTNREYAKMSATKVEEK